MVAMRVIAIDPPFCGCTECIVGDYVPLNEASPAQIFLMLMRKIRDNTSAEIISLDIVSKIVVFGAWTRGSYEHFEFDISDLQA